MSKLIDEMIERLQQEIAERQQAIAQLKAGSKAANPKRIWTSARRKKFRATIAKKHQAKTKTQTAQTKK